MQADRELLELAAMAAGMLVLPAGEQWPDKAKGRWFYCEHGPRGDGMNRVGRNEFWNPLTDDGDALRLAVKAGISVSFAHSTGLDVAYPAIVEVGAFAGWCPTFTEVTHDDWAAATRRAIVRAAAQLAPAVAGTAQE